MKINFFTYEDYTKFNDINYQFYDVTLTEPIGDYPVGAKFPNAGFNFEYGTVNFYDENWNQLASANIKREMVISLEGKE